MHTRTRRVVGMSCVIIAWLGIASLTGCGSSAKVQANTSTTGQELMDLETARDKGLLTEDEYAKKREQIMKRK